MDRMQYSEQLAAVVENFLSEDEWHYYFDERNGLFRFDLNQSSKLKKISFLVDIFDTEILVYAFSPIGCDASDSRMMSEMALFICRVNHALKNGSFELDTEDGSIRYKCYIDCEDLIPSCSVIKNSLYCIAMSFDKFAPGLLDIIFSDKTADEAFDRCEEAFSKKMAAAFGGDDDDGATDIDISAAQKAFGQDPSKLLQ